MSFYQNTGNGYVTLRPCHSAGRSGSPFCTGSHEMSLVLLSCHPIIHRPNRRLTIVPSLSVLGMCWERPVGCVLAHTSVYTGFSRADFRQWDCWVTHRHGASAQLPFNTRPSVCPHLQPTCPLAKPAVALRACAAPMRARLGAVFLWGWVCGS